MLHPDFRHAVVFPIEQSRSGEDGRKKEFDLDVSDRRRRGRIVASSSHHQINRTESVTPSKYCLHRNFTGKVKLTGGWNEQIHAMWVVGTESDSASSGAECADDQRSQTCW